MSGPGSQGARRLHMTRLTKPRTKRRLGCHCPTGNAGHIHPVSSFKPGAQTPGEVPYSYTISISGYVFLIQYLEKIGPPLSRLETKYLFMGRNLISKAQHLVVASLCITR